MKKLKIAGTAGNYWLFQTMNAADRVLSPLSDIEAIKLARSGLVEACDIAAGDKIAGACPACCFLDEERKPEVWLVLPENDGRAALAMEFPGVDDLLNETASRPGGLEGWLGEAGITIVAAQISRMGEFQ